MDANDIKKLIQDKGIDTIRLDYPDLHGVCRNKLIPATRIDEILEEGMACAQPVFAILLDNDIPPGTGVADEVAYGDMTIMPDLETFNILPYMENTARMVGDLFVGGKPWANSPRGFLKRVIADYEALGLTPVAASELEFYILKQNASGGTDYYSTQGCNCYTMNPRTDPQRLLRQLQLCLVEMGFDVLYYNHEYFPGQYEFNWKHCDALKMADQAFTFKAVAKEIGHLNDLIVTFMGRPKHETGGSGQHIHLSLNTADGANAFYDDAAELQLSETARHFMGGILKHARAMAAFLSPTINSYKRYVPDSFAPTAVGWGLDNRTTYMRVPAERGKATRVELRAPCASANPYLAIGMALQAGLLGIKGKLDPGKPFEGDMYRAAPGDLPQVPLSLFRALRELEADKQLLESIEPALIQNFLALKDGEIEAFRTAVTDWEFNHYGYHI